MCINIVVIVLVAVRLFRFPACPVAHLSIFIRRSLLSHTLVRSLFLTCSNFLLLFTWCRPVRLVLVFVVVVAVVLVLACRSPPMALQASSLACMHLCVCACMYKCVCTYARIVVALAADLVACLRCFVFIKFSTYMCVRVCACSCRCLLENLFVCTPLSPLYMYICMDLYTYIHAYACVCSQWIGLSLPRSFSLPFVSRSLLHSVLFVLFGD